MRFDLEIIASWIPPGARILDLGCGTGELLSFLRDKKEAACTGIDFSENNIQHCITKGLSVIHGDINEEVMDYADQAFDYVILSQTLQQVYEPEALLNTLLRIGKNVVVSFPNFSHWRCRLQLFWQGEAPTTSQLPYSWYNSPNIRVITIKDFRTFALSSGFSILKEVAINTDNQERKGSIIKILPTIRATYGIFLIGGTFTNR
ncbi:MAG: methionine biosynthesis protein MetW [Proteobacteria bacterium]|nr:methionine biosynthesis protein MetW [Desulfobulbaceae bacterium]MBU4153043.1 methionine biosynthesis protein MetW [Pseudomonadota bacterium]MDP2105515.1 methionine biosynthesis protein MetW [Desulfobulbaceae bacterium]